MEGDWAGLNSTRGHGSEASWRLTFSFASLACCGTWGSWPCVTGRAAGGALSDWCGRN